MIETLLGGLLGGAFRLAPELLKWLDRKGERGHELSMQDRALEFEKLRGAQRMDEIGAGADAAWNVGAIETLRDAVRTQGEKTGVSWADALSSSVRPVITYWFMALYCAAKTAAFVAAIDGTQHFAEDGKPSLARYADMVAADRDLRLAGYEVYRFGANELTGHGSAERIEAFFRRLLRKHAVLPGAGSVE